jgi:hypothetical protein
VSETWDDYDEHDECWECGGEGGWNSCLADICCAIGGEEGCSDPVCWRRCPNCGGRGNLPTSSEPTDAALQVISTLATEEIK